MDGWIKLHRKILENPVVMKDSDHLAVWIWLLLNASHKPRAAMFGKDKIELLPGQLITGWKKVADETHISASKVGRILKDFKSEAQIEVRSNAQGSLISICRWLDYQNCEVQSGAQVEYEWSTSGVRVETKQECKNVIKKDINNNARAREGRGAFDDDICYPPARDWLLKTRAEIKAKNEEWRRTHEQS